MATWREMFAPRIAAALETTKGQPEKEIRKALRDAYPGGIRRYWPYKVWCDEIRRQRGLKRIAVKEPDHTMELWE